MKVKYNHGSSISFKDAGFTDISKIYINYKWMRSWFGFGKNAVSKSNKTCLSVFAPNMSLHWVIFGILILVQTSDAIKTLDYSLVLNAELKCYMSPSIGF